MPARIVFLGDTLLGGEAQETLDRRGYAYAVEGIAPLLADADLVVANLEGPVTTLDQPRAKLELGRRRWWYRALPESLPALADAGIHLVSLANNHVLDYGPVGLRDTTEALDQAGIAHCGAGQDEPSAHLPVAVTLGGCRIVFLSRMQRYRVYEQERLYARGEQPGTALLDPVTVHDDLARVGDADLRVALVHWGRNYQPVTPCQRGLASALVGSGADLVVGHHPHVPQPVTLGRRGLVLYSLGNGVFGTRGRFAKIGCPPYGLVATVEVEGAGVAAVELRVIEVDNRRLAYRPLPASSPDAHRCLRGLLPDPEAWRVLGAGHVRATLRPSPAGNDT
ncbi:MAG: CapA family protein [Actinomycetota bacterium]|nr:CapA family protein [Actinomycetota bacterium]